MSTTVTGSESKGEEEEEGEEKTRKEEIPGAQAEDQGE